MRRVLRSALTCILAAISAAGCTSGPPQPNVTDQLPAGYVWAGGEEHGVRLGVPSEWVQRETVSDDLRARGGLAYLDPIGARDTDQYEAHLIASCGELPAVETIEQLERWMTLLRAQYHNPTTEIVTFDGTQLVRSEYDVETLAGEFEHWYAYNLLAAPGWMCAVTVTTPLEQPDRGRIEAVVETIGRTLHAAAPPS